MKREHNKKCLVIIKNICICYMSEVVDEPKIEDQCVHGCISKDKVDDFFTLLESFRTGVNELVEPIKTDITKLRENTIQKKTSLIVIEKTLHPFPSEEFKTGLVSNIDKLIKKINDHNISLSTIYSDQVFSRCLQNINTFRSNILLKARPLSEDKYSANQQLETFRMNFSNLEANKLNETQKRELGAFFMKDSKIKENYDFIIETLNQSDGGYEIQIKNKHGENDIYFMKTDGGIIKKFNGKEYFYVWSINEKGNIYFRQAELKDNFGSRLLHRVGGKTKKRRKNAKKRRKTRRK